MALTARELSRLDGKRTDWVTPSSVPDPEDLPFVHGWNLLIRPIEPPKEVKTATGLTIHLPSSYTEDMKFIQNVGKVVAVGPLCYTDNDGSKNPHGKYKTAWCKVGDYVVYGKHQGAKIEYKGVTYVVLADDLILLTVSDPLTINPQVNISKGYN